MNVNSYINSQVAWLVKNPPAKAEDRRDVGQKDHLEKEMETHFSNSCLENSMDWVWRAIFHGGHKELDTTEHKHAVHKDCKWARKTTV